MRRTLLFWVEVDGKEDVDREGDGIAGEVSGSDFIHTLHAHQGSRYTTPPQHAHNPG